jgi:hypothetical protein
MEAKKGDATDNDGGIKFSSARSFFGFLMVKGNEKILGSVNKFSIHAAFALKKGRNSCRSGS